MNAVISSEVAYRLAFETDEGLRTTPYGFASEEAAENAAPALNLVRFARRLPAYTHVVHFEGQKATGVRELEEVTA